MPCFILLLFAALPYTQSQVSATFKDQYSCEKAATAWTAQIHKKWPSANIDHLCQPDFIPQS